ncbi:MAG: LAGLIDADG family homing endonuclease [Patescibacteria group bacterium]|jgi:hypothetical protein
MENKKEIKIHWQPHPGAQTLCLEEEEIDEKLFGGGRGGGKLQPLDSVVYTPFGPKKMGDMQLGDAVSCPDGTVARVIAVYPQGVVDVYRVTFEDGSSCEVGLEHLWVVRNPKKIRFGKREKGDRATRWEVVTTAGMMKRLERHSLCIPLTAPVEFTVTSKNSQTRWPIHPYVLGAFLGDGHIGEHQLKLTSADPEIAEQVSLFGFLPIFTWSPSGSKAVDYSYGTAALLPFKRLGLSGKRSWEKFIPKRYFITPLKMRWELLRGLLDTDGYADSRGHSSFTTTSQQLAQDVQRLSWSLGFKANITSKIPSFRYKGERKKGRLAYTVWIKGQSHEDMFSIPRKKARAEQPYNGKTGGERGRLITSVRFSRRAEAQCIKISNPSGLYLTDDFIVTHNTDTGQIWLVHPKYISNPRYRGLVVRRQATDLSDWIDRAKWMYQPLKAEFTGSPAEIRFPSGAIIRTGHLGDKDAYTKYQGHEYQRQLMEEASHIPSEDLYERWVSSCRSTVPGLEARTMLTSNSDGNGRVWLKKRFRIGSEDGVPFETQNGKRRLYVPSTVRDNPTLMNDGKYLAWLESLSDPELKESWLNGSWDAFGIKGSYYGDLIVELRRKNRITSVPHENILPVSVWFDLGMDDSMSMGFFQFFGPQKRMIDYYEMTGMGIEHYVEILREKKYMYDTIWLPFDANVRELGTGKTRYEIFKSLMPGTDVRFVPRVSQGTGREVLEGINAVRSTLPNCWIDEEKCALCIECLENYRHEWDDTLQVFRPKPVHDKFSHGADMWRYFAVTSTLQQTMNIAKGEGTRYNGSINPSPLENRSGIIR